MNIPFLPYEIERNLERLLVVCKVCVVNFAALAALAGSQLRTNTPNSRNQPQVSQQTHEMTVPNDLIGCIIGKGGTKIAEIRYFTKKNSLLKLGYIMQIFETLTCYFDHVHTGKRGIFKISSLQLNTEVVLRVQNVPCTFVSYTGQIFVLKFCLWQAVKILRITTSFLVACKLCSLI